VACFLSGRTKDLSAPLYTCVHVMHTYIHTHTYTRMHTHTHTHTYTHTHTHAHSHIHTYTRTHTHTHTPMPATNPTTDGLPYHSPSTPRHLSSVAYSYRIPSAISSVGVPKCGCALAYYMLDAQLLLQPQFVGYRASAVCFTSDTSISSLFIFF